MREGYFSSTVEKTNIFKFHDLEIKLTKIYDNIFQLYLEEIHYITFRSITHALNLLFITKACYC